MVRDNIIRIAKIFSLLFSCSCFPFCQSACCQQLVSPAVLSDNFTCICMGGCPNPSASLYTRACEARVSIVFFTTVSANICFCEHICFDRDKSRASVSSARSKDVELSTESLEGSSVRAVVEVVHHPRIRGGVVQLMKVWVFVYRYRRLAKNQRKK
jgi:hypothetical protein